MSDKPIIQEKDGNICFSIFSNQTPDGKTYYSIQLQRSYKKKGDQEWTRQTIKLFPDDLLKLSEWARITYTDFVEYLHKIKAPKEDFPTQATNDTEIPF